MEPKVIIGALIGAIVGALLWAGLIVLANMEFAIVAIGIGAIVGGGAKLAGSDGVAAGVICAILALASILGGKVIGSMWSLPSQLAEFIESQHATELSQARYQEFCTDAEALEGVDSADYAEYMIDHGYTMAEGADEVTQEELDTFADNVVPMLQGLSGDSRPSYDAWREKEMEEWVALYSGEFTLMTLLTNSLGLMDILFIVLGMGAAFQIGNGGSLKT